MERGYSQVPSKLRDYVEGWTTMRPSWFITVALGITIVLIVRRIFRRRLKLPPGPPNLPIIGAVLSMGSQLHRVLADHAKKYGPLLYFKLGSLPIVVISSADVAEELFRHKDLEFASRAHSTILYSVATYFGFGASNMGFASWTPTVKQIRKVCTTELLSGSKLAHSEHIRWEEEGEMVREVELKCKEGKDFEVKDVLFTMTLNVISRMTLGKPYFAKNAPKTQEQLDFTSVMHEMIQFAGKPNISDLIPALRWLDPQGLTMECKELHRRQEKVLRALVDEHKQARAESHGRLLSRKTMDFVDMLLSLEGENKLSDIAIMGTIYDVFMAGTDSTSATTQWALIQLIRNPDKMAKLQKQLDEVVGRDRAMTESDIPKLPYLEAVIKETMRLHPTIPLLVPRMNEEQTTLRGYDIPKHSSLFVNVWAISRDPKLWDEAETFMPERFLDSPIHVVGKHFHYTPFGAGRRQCVGVTMGMLMAARTLGCLVHCFDFRPPQGKTISDVSLEEEFGLSLSPKQHLVCGAVPRLPSLAIYYDPKY